MNPAHLDYDTLADLAEGLLDDDQTASVNAHLDTCTECRERSVDLADVSRILAEAPVPSMPDELASRIDSAIAAESMHNATVVSLEQRRGRRHWRILSAAAAAVVVLGGGAMVGNMVLDGSTGADHQTSAGTPVQDPPDQRGSAKGAPEQSTLRAPQQPQVSGKGSYPVLHSGTDYRSGTFEQQVNGLVGGKERQLTLGSQAPDRKISECVDRVTQGRIPSVVDVARYDGSPATVIALPPDASSGRDVWVVDPDCSAQNADVIKHEKITP
jgi:hypothetical protein